MRHSSWILKSSVKTLTWLVILVVTGYGILAGFVALRTQPKPAAPADVIIVLGAKAHRKGSYNPCLQARVQTGVELLKNNHAPRMIFTGGTDYVDSKNEAIAMKDMALALGVSESQIVIEPKAHSTYTNLVLSQQIMKQHGWNSAIVVSEPFHLARASLVAHKLEINHTLAAATESPCWQNWGFLSGFFWREPAAIIGYVLLGYI